MIGSIVGGTGIVVDGGYATIPYVPNNQSNPMQGMLRIHGSSMEVFNGSSWQAIATGYATASLTPSAQSAVNWAMKKQEEEQELAELCKKHPSVAEAYERLQILKALTKTAESNGDT
jgi:hypothetical protein